MSSSTRFKVWFEALSDEEKIQTIQSKSSEIKKYYKAFQKATDALQEYGNNRVGVRGGKFTSLQAKLDIASQCLTTAIDELKYMTRNLNI